MGDLFTNLWIYATYIPIHHQSMATHQFISKISRIYPYPHISNPNIQIQIQRYQRFSKVSTGRYCFCLWCGLVWMEFLVWVLKLPKTLRFQRKNLIIQCYIFLKCSYCMVWKRNENHLKISSNELLFKKMICFKLGWQTRTSRVLLMKCNPSSGVTSPLGTWRHICY